MTTYNKCTTYFVVETRNQETGLWEVKKWFNVPFEEVVTRHRFLWFFTETEKVFRDKVNPIEIRAEAVKFAKSLSDKECRVKRWAYYDDYNFDDVVWENGEWLV